MSGQVRSGQVRVSRRRIPQYARSFFYFKICVVSRTEEGTPAGDSTPLLAVPLDVFDLLANSVALYKTPGRSESGYEYHTKYQIESASRVWFS